MGADEVATLDALTKRREILDGLIGTHGGRIANTAGDSVLAEFASAVDAVRCAMEAQGALAKANSGVPENRQINFRVGVHVGDVMVRAGDLFGDGVNIAARLQTLAKAGGLCVSGVTYDQVRKILPLSFTDLGAQTVKNIEEPIRAYEVKAQGEVASSALGEATSLGDGKPLVLPDKPSIAVLPFQKLSGDPEQDYFADGMVEDIITALSRKRLLFVIARNSSFTYKGKAVDIKRVGRELGVRYVLEGSVRKSGGRVRITGQLIDTTTGAHLWADKFDGGVEDIFDLQDKVTASVVGAIVPQLDRAEIDRSSRKPTANLEAYDYYLRGAASHARFTKEGSDAAFPHFQRAIELDPDFAMVHAAMAQWFAQQKSWGWGGDPSADAIKATAFARRAVTLGRDDAMVLSYSAWALAVCALDLKTAAAYLEEAIRLDPNLFLAWSWDGWVKVFLGEHNTAVDSFQRAVRLSPLDPRLFVAQNGLAYALFFLGRYTDAIGWADASVRNRPDFFSSLRMAIAARVLGGREEEARELWASVKALFPDEHVSELTKRLPYRDQDVAKLVMAFRRACTPE
jgi:TolB-like protein/tetratricopeptide (TPR) repeat protein